MDTAKFYDMFNNSLDEFIKELIKTFPDDTDFKLFKTSFNLLKIANVKKPLELFNLGLTNEYKQNIRDKNENFFLENDYSDVLNNKKLNELEQINKDDISQKLIVKLKDYWKNLNEDNQKIVWQYFTVLLKICDKVYL